MAPVSANAKRVGFLTLQTPKGELYDFALPRVDCDHDAEPNPARCAASQGLMPGA
jgi:hypothetical protein